jgi:ankyrin repeat protein
MSGNLDTFKQQLPTLGFEDNSSWLEKRNHEGKTILMLAAEHKFFDIFSYILEQFPEVDITKVDSRLGNTVLHLLCIHEQLDLAKTILAKNDRLALQFNYEGLTPIHIAVDTKNLELLEIFKSVKH